MACGIGPGAGVDGDVEEQSCCEILTFASMMRRGEPSGSIPQHGC